MCVSLRYSCVFGTLLAGWQVDNYLINEYNDDDDDDDDDSASIFWSQTSILGCSSRTTKLYVSDHALLNVLKMMSA